MKVLQVLDHSLPEQSGYTFRSHSILLELLTHGVEICALTSPKQGPVERSADDIDGVRYHRTMLAHGASVSGVRGQIRTVRSTRAHISRRIAESRSQLIHAHSPCLNGLAAIGQGLPLLYEMRSSWEDAAVSVGTITSGSLRYATSRALETFVARRAAEVVVICDGLKAELIDRGIAANKITVVPNALSRDMFELPSVEHAARIRARYGLQRARVIGFFGSFFEWEGIDMLVETLPAVLASEPDARLLLAGGGRQEAVLRRLVRERGLTDHVVFAGRVPHEEVRAFYAAADVVAYPRTADRLTQMVTPLKPLEAMAQCRPVVASDVGGHRELIANGETGFLFESGNARELGARLVEVLGASDEVARVVDAARRAVERERRWSAVCERYLPIYSRLASSVGR